MSQSSSDSSGSDSSSDDSDSDDDDSDHSMADESAPAAPVVAVAASQQRPIEMPSKQTAAAASTAAAAALPASANSSHVNDDGHNSEVEDGEVMSDSDSGADDDDDSDSDTGDSEFNDGYDDNLMGDSTDRARLEGLSEKERETEIFKRIERRDMMRTHWEIKRKLKHAKKAERDKDKTITPADKKKKAERKLKRKARAAAVAAAAAAAAKLPKAMPPPMAPIPKLASATPPAATVVASSEHHHRSIVEQPRDRRDSGSQAVSEEENWDDEPEVLDPKERSKERKKTVEANKTDDKRSNAMAMLKAKREGKLKRGE